MFMCSIIQTDIFGLYFRFEGFTVVIKQIKLPVVSHKTQNDFSISVVYVANTNNVIATSYSVQDNRLNSSYKPSLSEMKNNILAFRVFLLIC